MNAAKILLILAVVVFAVFAIIVVVGLLFVGLGSERVPPTTLLEVDLEQNLVEYIPSDPISEILFQRTPQVRDVVEGLAQAREDDKVVGLVARVGSSGMGLARIQEVRDAIVDFRTSGKKAVAWAETFGEMGPGNSAYYLASAFDEIYLQPSGDVGLTGLVGQGLFLAGALEKLDMEVRMDHRKEFKNAMNLFTETAFTEAHEEATRALVGSQFSQLTRGIAEGRGMGAEEVEALVDRGPFLGAEAVEAGLVDGLAYRDEVYAKVRESTDPKASLLYLHKYLERAGRPHQKGTGVALIYGTGTVVRGSGGLDPLTGSTAMGSDTVAGALRAAIADDGIEAILFRVDSPGGSYVASDTIWRETVRAREAGKPVIVSMGDVAASGGYFVAASADKIVAQPGTITGSIGVLGGKFLTTGLWQRLGITFDGVATSANATMWSSTEDYTEQGWQRLQDWLDRVYEDFTSKVAEGRNLDQSRVLEIAKGRVWTGEDALELGLVDELGGLDTALRLAREAAGLEPDAAVNLQLFPRPQSPYEQIFGKGPDSSETALVRAMLQTFDALRPVVRLAERLGLTEASPQPLRMPTLESIP